MTRGEGRRGTELLGAIEAVAEPCPDAGQRARAAMVPGAITTPPATSSCRPAALEPPSCTSSAAPSTHGAVNIQCDQFLAVYSAGMVPLAQATQTYAAPIS